MVELSREIHSPPDECDTIPGLCGVHIHVGLCGSSQGRQQPSHLAVDFSVLVPTSVCRLVLHPFSGNLAPHWWLKYGGLLLLTPQTSCSRANVCRCTCTAEPTVCPVVLSLHICHKSYICALDFSVTFSNLSPVLFRRCDSPPVVAGWSAGVRQNS